ncbi:Two pore calcium channel protein 1 [Nymphaea thermarum]|nr:Two pore calcium channel protein 1 [Nymphaea thermarum]
MFLFPLSLSSVDYPVLFLSSPLRYSARPPPPVRRTPSPNSTGPPSDNACCVSTGHQINLDEFYDLYLAISLQFQKEASPSWFEKYPSFYHSALCKYLKGFVRSSIFGYIIFSILALNLVTVIIFRRANRVNRVELELDFV